MKFQIFSVAVALAHSKHWKKVYNPGETPPPQEVVETIYYQEAPPQQLTTVYYEEVQYEDVHQPIQAPSFYSKKGKHGKKYGGYNQQVYDVVEDIHYREPLYSEPYSYNTPSYYDGMYYVEAEPEIVHYETVYSSPVVYTVVPSISTGGYKKHKKY